MGTPLVILALIDKRARLAGQLLDLDRQKEKLQADIFHIDQTLVVFGHRGDPEAINPLRLHVWLFKRRELATFVRESIRDGLSLDNREAALRLIAAKGWDAAEPGLVTHVAASIKGAKKRQRRAGIRKASDVS